MHFPGDLLCDVLGVAPEYFRAHPQELDRLVHIVVRAPAVVRGLGEIDFRCFSEALEEALPGFQKMAGMN